jgi:hypothetical protein
MEKINSWKKFNENQTANDIKNMFASFGQSSELGKISKIIQLLIQKRDSEVYSWGNQKTIDGIKKYINQIPKEKLEILSKKSSSEIQKIFQNSLQDLYNYLDKEGCF